MYDDLMVLMIHTENHELMSESYGLDRERRKKPEKFCDWNWDFWSYLLKKYQINFYLDYYTLT